MPVTVIICCVAALLLLSLIAVVYGRRPGRTEIVYGAALLVSGTALLTALAALSANGAVSSLVLPLGLPWEGGGAHFRIDTLAAFFLTVINLGGTVASLYGLGYGRHESAPHRVLPFFPVFLAGMNLVLMADDAFTFLLSWEFMSLSSWALVMSHHREPENARAGYIYIVMASFGTLALLLAFGLLAGPDGNYTFEAMRAGTPLPWQATAALLLVLLGTGSKAGLVPLHVWLPLAHPAAPSHVSALMSGVMTKVAVYGFIRFSFDLLGGTGERESMLILTLGGITAVLGILQALMQTDLKRLLAYSTVENIGIIFIGLGLALAFRSHGMDAMAALAFTAALFHVFNHAIFKSLLFFGAGAVLTATHERNMEKLGGLIHRMPLTAIAFLVGCAAISALPPLNGFVSEWLMFQSILQSPALPQWGLKILFPAIGCALALSAALAAACFVRAYGITFLGRPRTKAAEQAKEVDSFSLTTLFILASLCLLAGVLPGFILDGLAPVAQAMVGGHIPLQAETPWFTVIPIAESRSSYNGMVFFIFIAVSASLTALVARRLTSAATRRAPAWDCGTPGNDPATQYTAGSFSQPIRRVFGAHIFRTRDHVDMPNPGDLRAARFTVEMHDLVWEGLYLPLATGIRSLARRLNPAQFQTIRHYLGLVFLFLISLLLALTLWF